MRLEQRPRRLSRGLKQWIERVLRRELGRDERILFAYLRGSIVEHDAVRDVDVAVCLREFVNPLDYVLEKGLRLENILGLPVDIQCLTGASSVPLHRV